MGESVYKTDCRYYNDCMTWIVMNFFVSFGNRSVACPPDCSKCNAYCKKEKTNE